MPCAQRVEVHALDDREVADHQVARGGRRRHDAEAAIAHHRRGDAERRRGRERGVPGDLRVVVRVHVDDAGREHEPVGVDRLGALVLDLADAGDAAVLDREVGALGLVAQAVDDGGAADDEIDHRYLRPSERAIGGERRVIHQVADRGAHLHDLHRLLQAVDHRADHRDAAQPLHQARGDMRRVQARHHQHVGRAGQAAERIGLAQQLVVERHVGLHLAVILEVDLLGVEEADRLADAVDALDLAAAEVGEGEEGDPRLVAHGAGVARPSAWRWWRAARATASR